MVTSRRCRAWTTPVESLEDQLFSDVPQDMQVQRRSFELRKSLVLLRRIVIPCARW
jgi:magnesium transporter